MTHFDFIGNSKKFFGLSIALLVIITLCSFILPPLLDIQFKGGSMITYAYDGDIDVTSFSETADDFLSMNVTVLESVDLASQTKTLVVTLPGSQSLTSEEMSDFTAKLQETYSSNNLHSIQINNVDATIGREFLSKCIVAVLFASVLMILYVGFRFKRIGGLSAGVMALLALVHDVIVVFGVFVIFRIPIDDNFIAVVLTILGFSLNDTIVIYDRIRENKRLLGAKTPIGELVNVSINQSFTRSLNTSLAAIMTMIVVSVVALLYNVDSIQSFAFPMILGLVSGVYSTICIAGPLWVKWQEHKLAQKSPA